MQPSKAPPWPVPGSVATKDLECSERHGNVPQGHPEQANPSARERAFQHRVLQPQPALRRRKGRSGIVTLYIYWEFWVFCSLWIF